MGDETTRPAPKLAHIVEGRLGSDDPQLYAELARRDLARRIVAIERNLARAAIAEALFGWLR